MKTKTLHRSKILITLVVLALAIPQISCNLLSQTANPGAAQTQPAEAQLPSESGATADRPVHAPAGGYDLTNPALGLEGLSSYQQSFTISLRGDLQKMAYEEVQHIERSVLNQDETVLISERVNANEPVYLFTARLGSTQYSQEREGSACRAEPLQAAPEMAQNPALRLPAVFGMQEDRREELNGLAAIHYTFDEGSLVDGQGVIQSASGEAWVAQDSGLVLSYSLTVDLAAEGFFGSRSWVYELDQVDLGVPVRLPQPCPPVLTDLPVMPGAIDLLDMPGFQRYSVDAGRSQAAAFYYNQLTALGWKALPGSAPDAADLTSPTTALSFARGYQEGGQVLVIQLSDQEGLLLVIVQAVITKAPIQYDESAPRTIQPGEDGEDEEDPGSDSGPTSAGQLPEDLPAYPGASVITQMETALFLETQGSLADVASFYTAELEGLGWSLDEQVENPGMTLMMWSRNSDTLMLTIMESGGTTQVMISAAE